MHGAVFTPSNPEAESRIRSGPTVMESEFAFAYGHALGDASHSGWLQARTTGARMFPQHKPQLIGSEIGLWLSHSVEANME